MSHRSTRAHKTTIWITSDSEDAFKKGIMKYYSRSIVNASSQHSDGEIVQHSVGFCISSTVESLQDLHWEFGEKLRVLVKSCHSCSNWGLMVSKFIVFRTVRAAIERRYNNNCYQVCFKVVSFQSPKRLEPRPDTEIFSCIISYTNFTNGVIKCVKK